MKIGILTFHDGINYGCFLQVYALLRWLKENTDHDVQVVNYKDYQHWKLERDHFFAFQIKWNKNILRFALNNLREGVRIIKNAWKVKKFKRAHKSLNMTDFTHSVETINTFGFDLIIVGSDEIWNFDHPLVGYVPAYFGVGLENTELISYAGSFGAVDFGTEVPDEVVQGLKKFSSISVRDKSSYDIVNAHIRPDPTFVIDPVFLHDFSGLEQDPEEKNYILVYFASSCTKQDVRNIKEFAARKNKKLLGIGYSQRWCDYNIVDAGPFEFLGYLKNADYIVTSMFHGTMFAIKYGRQFCTISTEYRLNKFSAILKELELDNRLILDVDYSLSTIFEKSIDYEAVHAKIETLRVDSVAYLEKAISS